MKGYNTSLQHAVTFTDFNHEKLFKNNYTIKRTHIHG